MKKALIVFLAIFSIVAIAGCYKDLGTYSYDYPETPSVNSLDTVYSVFVGDSLIIDAGVSTSKGTDHLRYHWKIAVPEKLSQEEYTGNPLRMIFGLGPTRYPARLTITDTITGMKYFHDFAIDGKTAFSRGMVVLSNENGAGQLSFIKPDGTVQARLYEAMHGENLPASPTQIIPVRQAYNPGTIRSYWIFGGEGDKPGVRLDANTMQRSMYINDNFFDAPKSVDLGQMTTNFYGVITGVVNGKLYAGTTSTWDQNPLYGMFGLATPGDYTLSDKFIFNFNMASFSAYYIGYEKNKKQFLRFNLYGNPQYFGTDYAVIGDAFDPKDTRMDLLHMEQINGEDVYAFMKDAAGIIYELRFSANFNGPFQIVPIYKRAFKQQDLFSGENLIRATQTGVFYFAKGDKIYRYNPLNEDIRTLQTNFPSAVTMLSLTDNDNTLIAGTAGKLDFLDISTGQNGQVKSSIAGIPGNPVDIAIRD